MPSRAVAKSGRRAEAAAEKQSTTRSRPRSSTRAWRPAEQRSAGERKPSGASDAAATVVAHSR